MSRRSPKRFELEAECTIGNEVSCDVEKNGKYYHYEKKLSPQKRVGGVYVSNRKLEQLYTKSQLGSLQQREKQY